MVETPIAAAVAPLSDQGEMLDKPRPKPRISKINESAGAHAAPARIAPQETPD